MKIGLAYGKKRHVVEIPGHLHTEVVEPRYVEGVPDQLQAVRDALKDPIGHKPLSSAVEHSQKVAIIFSDITRATPYQILVPALLDSLSHIPDHDITFFCATGTHRDATPGELVTILGKEVTERFRIVQNEASNRASYQYVGTTASGNRIMLNKKVLEHDLRVLTGFIEPHFFAGFSGGGKALMPGMAYVETIRHNHSIRNLEHPKARWGYTRENPLWEEVMEAAEFATPVFLLNITLNRDKEITGVFAGDLRKAHLLGCAKAKETAMVGLDKPFDVVLTSNAGYPLDLNVYQSVKGMSAAERVVKKGGTIILAAECWDGIPAGSDYEIILSSVDKVQELMGFIKNHEPELKDTWQVFFQAMIQMKADVYLYSGLDPETVKSTHLKPVEDMNQLIVYLVEKYGPATRICILPEGPHTIPYLE
ncbi:MAG: nickel-dependent lactate racemase [Bacteroidales bacterium]|nr:nickel-dependent lactate racemase [Bacteroidales bacterium]